MVRVTIGKPMYTECGTRMEKYIENGIIYKSFHYYQSTNKAAKKLGLQERVFKYDQNKRPVEYTDTIELKKVFPERKPVQVKYPGMLKIKYKKIEPKDTRCKTRYYKEIENGRLRKHVCFENSTNKVAKEQGIMYFDTNFGLDLRPDEIRIGYKKKTIIPVKESEKQNNILPAEKTGTGIKTETEDDYFGTLGADSKESFCEAYRKTDRRSVLYQDYDIFIYNVRDKLKKYEDILPPKLYQDIMNRYGYEEMSIRKILQDNDFDIEKIELKPSQKNLRRSFTNLLDHTEKKEQQFAQIRLANQSEKLSVIYTNAWTNSRLRCDMAYETTKSSGNTWSILREVWSKLVNPEETEYKTEDLIDSYLIRMFQNRGNTKIYSYNSENPLQKLTEDKTMNNKKVIALKIMYSGVKNLGKKENKKILNNPGYQEFKDSADLKAMAKTIENFEKHYKDAFLKCFWTNERKFRFSEVLKHEIKDFGDKIELSNDIYEALIREALLG